MVFSEPTFLFFFLPAVIAVYFIAPERVKNVWLLASSIGFYAWGEEAFVGVLIGMIVFNHVAALAIAGAGDAQRRKRAVIVGVASNLAVLFYFKYAHFIASSLTGNEAILAHTATIHLPIGISFYTFQALTYLVDLYRREIALQRDPVKLAVYISMFPQLVAGPIVRYSEVEGALGVRRTTRDDFVAGMKRFIVGLAKKALIADPLGRVVDQVFAIPAEGLSTSTAWLGVACYALQIYFDFAAYSDMAIGLGRIFGFRFPENFNFPYIAQSVTEFWRRWHMTLSRWFRDYLYVPLGGNRAGPARTYANLVIVFLLCGFWHGASWNFLIWGAYHGLFLVIERLGFQSVIARAPNVLRHAYLLVVVAVGWTPFRAETLGETMAFLHRMFIPGGGDLAALFPVERFVDGYVAAVILAGIILATPAIDWARAQMGFRLSASHGGAAAVTIAGYGALLLAAVVAAGAASYSPFIYFRF